MRNLRKPLQKTLALFGNGLLNLTLIAGLQAAYGQTTYYVATSGNDGNNGRSADAPFQTLSKVNSLALQPGDQILFRRGDTFRGTLNIRQSGTSDRPIIIDAYGSGNKPALSGSVPLSNWSNVGGNVWQADCPSCGSRVTGVYRNGSALPLGRYPNANAANKGYLTVQSHSGKGQLTSQQGLPANFSGGEAVIRTVQWITDRAAITQQNGNSLSLNNPNSTDLGDGWGFFVQNHPSTLDQNDEWYYNAGNKTIRLYSDQGNPGGQTITATVYNEAISLANVNYITIRNLNITQALTTGLLIQTGSNIVISGNDITDAGEDGVYIDGSGSNILAENNLIEDANNNGFTIQPYQNFTFRGNTVRRVGINSGRGRGNDGNYIAVKSLCYSNTLIENNVIDNVGYIGISFTSNTTIRRNRISNFCSVKSDGGGLYTWNGNKNNTGGIVLTSNIISDGIGAPEGTPGGAYSGANGIFLDDCSQNAEVSNNTIFNCHGLGLFMRANSNVQVKGNTIFNNGEGQLSLTHNHGLCLPRNNTIENNIFVSKLPTQFNVKFESNQNDLGSYGQFDRNVYSRPFEDVFKIFAVYNPGSGVTGSNLSLADWQSRFGKDPNSTNSPITYKTYTITGTGATKLNNAFSGGADGWSNWSNYGNGQANWDNSNRLDGGSLRIGFGSNSNRGDSYVLASNPIGSVNNGKTYLLKFDAIASGANKRVEVFLRQKTGSYRDLDSRSVISVGTSRQNYEMTFTANADEGDAILVLQVPEDGQTLWVDNVTLQEANKTANNPDDFVKLAYNDSGDNRQVGLDGTYKDARNNVYNNSVTVAPFSSVVLYKVVGTTTQPQPQPQPSTLRDPENPSNAVAGLDYQYYEGSWSTIPNLDALTPNKTGSIGSPDLSVRNRDENFSVSFKGYINVPTDGQYTFYTASDDGSKLLIGSTTVVDNDGLHGDQERSGTIGLKAGKHAISIQFLQGGGGRSLTVSYSGPNLGKQTIPTAAFFRVGTTTTQPQPQPGNLRDPENPSNAVAGLDYKYYEGSWSNIPNYDALTPAKTGSIGSPDLSVRGRDENFGVSFRGYVNIPADGQYTFYTTSDDGSKLLIGSTTVVDNDGLHGDQEKSGTIGLKAGKHAISILFLQGGGGRSLTVSYSGPNLGKQVIPASAFFRTGNSQPSGSNPTTTYLSDMNWTSATNGYGPVEKDRSNGESGAGDGRTITLNGVTYAKGLGVHGQSEIVYNLGGKYNTFITDIGVDDELNGTCGSVEFQVYLDNVLVYNSGTMTPASATKSVNIDVSGKQTLKLVVTNANDGSSCDHGDWAGARVISNSGARQAASIDEFKAEVTVQVYPIPARDVMQVRYYAQADGELSLQLVSTSAQPVLASSHQVVAGENLIKVPVREISRGFYILALTQGQNRITRKVILAE